LRARRRALTPLAQRQAARALARRLWQLPVVRHARRLGIYHALDGEIDPAFFSGQARRAGKILCLPILRTFPSGQLLFVARHPGRRERHNRFGIPEPMQGRRYPAQALDVILLPLVGFDECGGRLGMGGGFYDRTLAYKVRQARRKPVLIGLAHACQQVDTLTLANWDVALDAVVTDRSWHASGRRRHGVMLAAR
jgi:5-formyltetrahydrofolate cyclo-ligase